MGATLAITEASIEVLRAHLSAHARDEGIAAAWLFGSVARGAAGPGSDVDVGVLYCEAPPRTLAGIGQVFALEEELTEVSGLPVQVVNLNLAPVDLIIRVLRDGKLLLDRHPLRRIEFEVLARKAFWDLQPLLQLYREPSVALP